MAKNENTIITVQTSVKAPVDKVWKHWTTPESITGWNNASDDWHTPRASSDLRQNGKFSYRMEARDGSMGFDFEGTYDEIIVNRQIDYTMADGRKVQVTFSSAGANKTDIVESFEAESTHSLDQQRSGWQSILDNFRKFTESAD
jgi:uncharacterized protein YndB with AHSA1/START domain